MFLVILLLFGFWLEDEHGRWACPHRLVCVPQPFRARRTFRAGSQQNPKWRDVDPSPAAAGSCVFCLAKAGRRPGDAMVDHSVCAASLIRHRTIIQQAHHLQHGRSFSFLPLFFRLPAARRHERRTSRRCDLHMIKRQQGTTIKRIFLCCHNLGLGGENVCASQPLGTQPITAISCSQLLQLAARIRQIRELLCGC